MGKTWFSWSTKKNFYGLILEFVRIVSEPFTLFKLERSKVWTVVSGISIVRFPLMDSRLDKSNSLDFIVRFEFICVNFGNFTESCVSISISWVDSINSANFAVLIILGERGLETCIGWIEISLLIWVSVKMISWWVLPVLAISCSILFKVSDVEVSWIWLAYLRKLGFSIMFLFNKSFISSRSTWLSIK